MTADAAAVAIVETVPDYLNRCGIDDANNRWWYEFGRQVGIAEGRAEADELIERIRLTRAEIASLQPTGETGPDGWPVYVRRRSRA